MDSDEVCDEVALRSSCLNTNQFPATYLGICDCMSCEPICASKSEFEQLLCANATLEGFCYENATTAGTSTSFATTLQPITTKNLTNQHYLNGSTSTASPFVLWALGIVEEFMWNNPVLVLLAVLIFLGVICYLLCYFTRKCSNPNRQQRSLTPVAPPLQTGGSNSVEQSSCSTSAFTSTTSMLHATEDQNSVSERSENEDRCPFPPRTSQTVQDNRQPYYSLQLSKLNEETLQLIPESYYVQPTEFMESIKRIEQSSLGGTSGDKAHVSVPCSSSQC